VSVWGSSTYCVFVVAAPTGVSWNRVHDFVASVFRWNAPPSKTIRIGGIAGSPGAPAGASSYDGLMDAGAKVRSGAITERDFVAGELAFLAAVRGAPVSADLSAWSRNAGNTGSVVLGNVAASAPTHAESVYSALDNGDGTVQIAVGRASGGAAASDLGSVVDSYGELDRAYRAYLAGTGPKPNPKRCGGALYLAHRFGEPVRSGLCDEGLVWESDDDDRAAGRARWSDYTNASASPPYQTIAPHNGFMLIRAAGSADFERRAGDSRFKPVLGETYVQFWERAHE
jgi:hypothetical protein